MSRGSAADHARERRELERLRCGGGRRHHRRDERRSNAAIAARLFVTPRTVEAHIRQILGKLDLPESPDDHRRVLAVLAFLKS